MLLKSLIMRNFLPYKGENIIFFATDRVKNVTVINGENTQGKTSILNAFRWVLYGRPMYKDKETIPISQLLNYSAADDGETSFDVELRFSFEDSDYILTRAGVVPKDGEPSSGLTLVKNGEPISEERAVRIVNSIAPEEISRFFLFDGELLDEYENLLDEASATAKKIKNSIENVLGVPSLIAALEALKDVHTNLLKSSSVATKRTQGQEAATEQRDEKIDERDKLKADRDSIQEMLTQSSEELDALSIDLGQHEEKFKEYQDQIRMEGSIENMRSNLEIAKTTYQESLSEIWAVLVMASLQRMQVLSLIHI